MKFVPFNLHHTQKLTLTGPKALRAGAKKYKY